MGGDMGRVPALCGWGGVITLPMVISGAGPLQSYMKKQAKGRQTELRCGLLPTLLTQLLTASVIN